MKNSSSGKNNIVFWVVMVLFMAIIFEILSSLVLIYTYRSKHYKDIGCEASSLSSINLICKVAIRFGIYNDKTVEFARKTDPVPFYIQDPVMGYSASSGEYTHIFLRKYSWQKEWDLFKTKVTINKDGSRWTGEIEDDKRPKIYVFGDSFVFGTGVNDEQTFSSLLQQAMPNYEVKLYAFGGWSLTQAYLKVKSLKESINSSDIIILGYGDYYDERHVMSPSWVRNIYNSKTRKDADLKRDFSLLKASLDENGEIEHGYVNRDCSKNNGYCEKQETSSSNMTNLTAALVNYIANNTKAKVYMLHFKGDYDNPVFELINDKVTRISALPGDFDYFIVDDIEGFDPHPGPYWHYAISRKLFETLLD